MSLQGSLTPAKGGDRVRSGLCAVSINSGHHAVVESSNDFSLEEKLKFCQYVCVWFPFSCFEMIS